MEAVNEKPAARQPIWIPIVQGVQCCLALVILALSAYLIHGKYFDTLGYDIFTCLLTWVVIVFLFLTTYLSALSSFRNIFIVIGSNALLVIFWLAAMGATARLRTSFKYDVDILGCYDDGSSVDSTTCLVARSLNKRYAVATSLGLSMMSAIAGLAALEMVLFIAVLVHNVLIWHKGRSTVATEAPAPQKQEEGYPMSAPQQPQQQTYSPAPQQAYTPSPEQQYAQQPYAQQPYVQQQQYPQQPYAPQGQQMPGPPQGNHNELPTPTRY